MDSPNRKDGLIVISDLRLIFNAIFDSIENDLGFKDVTLNKDYYYSIPDADRYNMQCDPVDYNVGQLFEDWDFLKIILKDGSMATPMNLIHLAPLIDYLATQVDWYGTIERNPSSN